MTTTRFTDLRSFSNKLEELQYDVVEYKHREYINLPCSFDIETTSTHIGEDKIALMYAFMVDINHIIYFGRTWEDFYACIAVLRNKFNISQKHRLIVYVHNLSYEFGFIEKRFEWIDMLALKNRKPIFAVTDFGLEFRCSLLLSGYKLETLAKAEKLPIKKLVGDLDYDKVRHSETPISDEESNYLENDVECVVYYIEKKMRNEESVAHIPLTKTSFVRRLTRNNCDVPRYHYLMKNLTLEPEEYRYLKVAFQGGFTHSNPFNTGKIINEVSSFDFASSYPAVMVAEKYPMSKAIVQENPSNENFRKMIKIFCCIIDIEFTNLKAKDEAIDFPLSGAREKTNWKNGKLSNGRLIEAEFARTIITEQDFFTIEDFYDFDSFKVNRLYMYRKGYLPTEFIESLLTLYKTKTELKGVLGREEEYMNAKENINSCYGMMVTDILRDEILYEYEEGWGSEKPDSEKGIKKYNVLGNRFLYYPWGVWVTAYARRNLFSAIKEIQHDYVYSDTDSVKIRNRLDHMDYFNKYNEAIKLKLQKALEYHNLPLDLAHPKTIKGKEKWLGVWEYEGDYYAFKCMNAKRYMTFTETDDQTGMNNWISITVAGLNKNVAVRYLLESNNVPYTTWEDGTNVRYYLSNKLDYKKIFNYFKDGMEVPAENTGKLAATYIEETRRGKIKDYLGNVADFEEYSSVHLEKSPYRLSMIEDFIEFVMKVQGVMIGDEST